MDILVIKPCLMHPSCHALRKTWSVTLMASHLRSISFHEHLLHCLLALCQRLPKILPLRKMRPFLKRSWIHTSWLHRQQPLRALDTISNSPTTSMTEGVLCSFLAIDVPKTQFTVEIPQRWAGIGGEVGGLKPKTKSVPGEYGLVARLSRKPGPYPGL